MVVRREIGLGPADGDANRITSAQDVLKEFGFEA
jgi:hypothetical protein